MTTMVVPFSESIKGRHVIEVACRLPWSAHALLLGDGAADVLVHSLYRKSQPALCLLAPVIVAEAPWRGEWFTGAALGMELGLFPNEVAAGEPLCLVVEAKTPCTLRGSLIAGVERVA